MKVVDLKCSHGHGFEGWFGSEDDFQGQLSRGLVECPMCGDAKVEKQLSAPRLNLSGASAPAQENTPQTEALSESAVATSTAPAESVVSRALAQLPPEARQELQAEYLRFARHVVENTTDVGTQFAKEARRIHDGDAPERAIRGQATRDEAIELMEDGIAVLPLLLPEHLKGTLQ